MPDPHPFLLSSVIQQVDFQQGRKLCIIILVQVDNCEESEVVCPEPQGSELL